MTAHSVPKTPFDTTRSTTCAPIVFVTGAPGAGKSTLAREVARRIRAPFLYKDGIKESLFDELVVQDLFSSEITRPITEQLSAVARHVLFESVLGFPLDVPVVIEGDFGAGDIPPVLQTGARPLIELHCKCDREIRLQRHAERTLTDRHPVHCDDESTAEFLRTIPDEVFGPHGLGSVHVIDTTDVVDLDKVMRFVNYG